MSSKAHMEEQRRRLEHFKSVAKQARARNDVKKIQELLDELHSSEKCLPQSRINELKHLEVMTSPSLSRKPICLCSLRLLQDRQ